MSFCTNRSFQTGLAHPYAASFGRLKAAEAKYRSIYEHAPMGIYRSTPEGRYLEANPACARIFGYDTPQQMIEEISDIARQVYGSAEQRRDHTEFPFPGHALQYI